MKHYTEHDLDRIARSRTFEDIVPVALGVIARMPRPVALVSGPISSGGLGSVQANIVRFHAVIGYLEARGVSVFDQMPLEEHFWRIMKDDAYYRGGEHLLEAFYGTLLDSGSIQQVKMIPGWEGSYGARWEHDRALRNGIPVEYLTLSWLRPLA
ncbi:MAG TPA: hypothetical protein VD862_03390 [Candidatus Paceibacterota bacterium]|nr:hypothetical protein [Candidatus Paceibacterota bacterium]